MPVKYFSRIEGVFPFLYQEYGSLYHQVLNSIKLHGRLLLSDPACCLKNLLMQAYTFRHIVQVSLMRRKFHWSYQVQVDRVLLSDQGEYVITFREFKSAAHKCVHVMGKPVSWKWLNDLWLIVIRLNGKGYLSQMDNLLCTCKRGKLCCVWTAQTGQNPVYFPCSFLSY